MPHVHNVEAIAQLLYRAEHWELGITPPFERLPQHRQDEYRRKAQFLSSRGVIVPSAVAADLETTLAGAQYRGSAAQIQEMLERIARSESA